MRIVITETKDIPRPYVLVWREHPNAKMKSMFVHKLVASSFEDAETFTVNNPRILARLNQILFEARKGEKGLTVRLRLWIIGKTYYNESCEPFAMNVIHNVAREE